MRNPGRPPRSERDPARHRIRDLELTTSQLTQEQILATSPKLEETEVPEWGGLVFIRPITLAEQAKLTDLGASSSRGDFTLSFTSERFPAREETAQGFSS